MRSLACKSLSILRFINTFTRNSGFETVFEIMDDENASLDIAFQMMANATLLACFIPRMDLNRYIPELNRRAYKYMRDQAKNLNPSRIDLGYYCIDFTGRKLYSLTEVYYQ